MLTIFTTPKPFHEQSNIIQRNAIQSWLKLFPKPEIILFGDEEGTTKIAKEFNLRHISEIALNEFGTPLVNDIFGKAQKMANYDILACVNADIILMSDFIKAIQQTQKLQKGKFLIVGRRWDLDVKELINFKKIDWERKLCQRINKEGRLHGASGIDYLVFPRYLWQDIPPFAHGGRPAWDNWLLHQAWSMNAPLINATKVIMAVHQNHTYSQHPKGRVGVRKGAEAKKNLKLAGGESHLFTIRDANFILAPSGLKKSKLTIYRVLSFPFRHFEKAPFFAKIFLLPGWLGMVLWRKIKRSLI